MATIKEELLVLGIKANSNYIRQVAVTYRHGISVVRNLKFLTPFFIFLITIINIILSTNRSYVILPYDTNRYTFLKSFYTFNNGLYRYISKYLLIIIV